MHDTLAFGSRVNDRWSVQWCSHTCPSSPLGNRLPIKGKEKQNGVGKPHVGFCVSEGLCAECTHRPAFPGVGKQSRDPGSVVSSASPLWPGTVCCASRGLACFLRFFPLHSVNRSCVLRPPPSSALYLHNAAENSRSEIVCVSLVTCRLAKTLFFFPVPTEEELRPSDEGAGQHNVDQRNDTGRCVP